MIIFLFSNDLLLFFCGFLYLKFVTIDTCISLTKHSEAKGFFFGWAVILEGQLILFIIIYLFIFLFFSMARAKNSSSLLACSFFFFVVVVFLPPSRLLIDNQASIPLNAACRPCNELNLAVGSGASDGCTLRLPASEEKLAPPVYLRLILVPPTS